MSRSFLVLLILAAAVAPVRAAEPSTERPSATVQDVFDGMRASFRPEKAAGVHARYQWEITGDRGGQWWIEVNDGWLKMGRGRVENPNVTFVVSDKDWVAISNGKLSGTWAFVTGRLKIRGEQSTARKLDGMFP